MKILITAGGTSEKIDHIRAITNSGTGMLGSLTASCFLDTYDEAELIYLCTDHACIPQADYGDRLRIIYADDVAALLECLPRILTEYAPDIIIHSMAISDYQVVSVCDEQGHELDRDGKISSNHDELIVRLARTPKIISMFRPMLADAIIIGFKLLADAGAEELRQAAYDMLSTNSCDYVLANELSHTSREDHIAYLISRENTSLRIDGKAQIAEALVSTSVSAYKRKVQLT